jgi:uncharacterized protein
MIPPNDLFSPLTVQEYDELDEFLLSLDADEGICGVSELDGFFTAVVSGPEMIAPSQWLPMIWGDDEDAPVWESEQEFQRIFGLLIRLMNSISATLMEEPMEFEPCFLESTVGGDRVEIVDNWCSGYMKAVALHSQLWEEMPMAYEDYLAPMVMFATEEGWDQLERMERPEIEFWQGQIAKAARRIHAYWLAQREGEADPYLYPTLLPTTAANDGPVVRDSPKTGRNDPCPCGSGKKYKLCCGRH